MKVLASFTWKHFGYSPVSTVKVFTSQSKNSQFEVISSAENSKFYNCTMLATYITHFWLVFFCTFLMNKYLNSVNLSLELHVVSTFWLESDTLCTFSLYFAQPLLKLERLTLKIHILCCKTDICSWKLSAKVSLMLDNPVPIPFLYKLKHTNVYFIQKSIKITCRYLIPFRESHVFLKWSPVFWATW